MTTGHERWVKHLFPVQCLAFIGLCFGWQGLAAIKWVAGSGVKYANTGGPRKKTVEDSTAALRERESSTIKAEPGSLWTNGGAPYINDIAEPSAPPGTAVPTPVGDCMVRNTACSPETLLGLLWESRQQHTGL